MFLARTAVRFIAGVAAFILPSILMGMTTPTFARAVAAHRRDSGRWLARLYGWNTLGAALGAFASAYILVPSFGLVGAMLLASVLNFSITMIREDGRSVLLERPDRYDVISLEVSSIWFAGVGSIYSREFYELASKRLRRNGVMLQYFPIHHLSARNLYLVVNTAHAVFPYVSVLDTSSPRLRRSEQRAIRARFGVDPLRSGKLRDGALPRGACDGITTRASQRSRGDGSRRRPVPGFDGAPSAYGPRRGLDRHVADARVRDSEGSSEELLLLSEPGDLCPVPERRAVSFPAYPG